jgi:transketolase
MTTAAGMRESFARTTTDLLDEDLSVALVLADISAALFVDAAQRHPDRVVNVGIREQLAVNVGAGMALTGMRPIVHTFASFLVERSFEQIKLGFSHQDVGGVLVSAGASYDVSAGGRTHQSPGDVALIDTLPDWEVAVPGHTDEMDALLRRAVAGDGRVYLRTTTASNRKAFPIGPMSVLRRGSRGTVVAVGTTLDPVLEATRDLDVTVLYASTVRPFDAGTLVGTLGFADVVIVEPYAAGTSAHVVGDALRHVPHRLLSLGVPRAPELRRYGSPREHERAHALDAIGLHRSIADFLAA